MSEQEYSQTPVAKSLRKRKQALKASGLCQDCGMDAPKPGRTLCKFCLCDRSIRAKRSYDKKKAAAL